MTAARVCLITTGQPSTNPRLVKEADALISAGYEVRVIGAYSSAWALESDRSILAHRAWTFTAIDWRRERAPWLFWKSRIRHRVARGLAGLIPDEGRVADAAVFRMTPELVRAAERVPADVYIAHNLGALPAACRAAGRHGALAGFDAEDFHSGELPADGRDPTRRLRELVERTYIPRCAHLTAAAPGIADAYRALCGVPQIDVVLNVFPLASRPATRRTSAADRPLRLYWFSQTIGPGRGLEDAVRAIGPLAASHGSGLELHLRGTWAIGYETILRALARDVGVPQASIVHHPPAPADEMVRLAAEFDVGLALEPGDTPNSQILLSNKLGVYALAGLATAATTSRGQKWWIEQMPGAGVLCRAGDPGDLGRQLAPWLRDRQRLELARAQAWRLGESRFNWDREQHVFLQVLARTLSAARSRAAMPVARYRPGPKRANAGGTRAT